MGVSWSVSVAHPRKVDKLGLLSTSEPQGLHRRGICGTLRINASPAWARQAKPDRKQAPSKINVSVSRAYLGA